MPETDVHSLSNVRRRTLVTTENEKNGSGSNSGETGEGNGKQEGVVEEKTKRRFEWKTPGFLQWIPASFTFSKLKPAIRCAVAAWIALVLFVIPPVQRFFGQASFLILIASVLSPPNDPFISVLEREVLIMLLASLTWAWACLGIKFADMARTNHYPNATLSEAVYGTYIEVAPAVIIGVFIFLGSSFILFFRAHKGPGPYIFPYISLTTAVLFPFPYYNIGKVVVLPLAFHSAIALLTSIVIFPTTISANFTTSLSNVLSPLIKALEQHKAVLEISSRDPTFPEAAALIATTVAEADSALTPVNAAVRLLRSDLIYCRFSPDDFLPFHDLVRRAAVRANGMGVYFSIIDPTRPRFPTTPAPSAPQSPALS
ncbi:hypothetical protein H0H93_006863, partial [Arthromyces matolae]